jgi:hypothetical protein
VEIVSLSAKTFFSFPFDIFFVLIFVVSFLGMMLIIGSKGTAKEKILFSIIAILVFFHIGIVDYWQKVTNFILSNQIDTMNSKVEQIKILETKILNLDCIFLFTIVFCGFLALLYITWRNGPHHPNDSLIGTSQKSGEFGPSPTEEKDS